jgi:hypothetical protein
MWGKDNRSSVLIRQGIKKQVSQRVKPLDPGATSKKRQDHGKRQWRQFLSKEEYEVRKAAKVLEDKRQKDND